MKWKYINPFLNYMTQGASFKKSPNILMYIEKNKIVAFSLLHLVMQEGCALAKVFSTWQLKMLECNLFHPFFNVNAKKVSRNVKKYFLKFLS